jgi:type II secretion system protein C
LEYVGLEEFGEGMITDRPASALEKGPGAAPPPAKGEPGAGVKEMEQGKFMVDRAEVDNALSSMDQLFTQIRAVPQFKEGKAAGLKVLSVKSGSLFAKLGLKRNDVLERVNGQAIDMKQGMEIFTQLKDSQQISIDLLRDGKKTTLEYNIQ